VLRRSRWAARDLVRSYRVLLDGGEVSRIKRGQTFEFNVMPGPHTIQLALDERLLLNRTWPLSWKIDVNLSV